MNWKKNHIKTSQVPKEICHVNRKAECPFWKKNSFLNKHINWADYSVVEYYGCYLVV